MYTSSTKFYTKSAIVKFLINYTWTQLHSIPDVLLTINVFSWVPASTAYVISCFASFLTIPKTFRLMICYWYGYTDWKHPASVFELQVWLWVLHQKILKLQSQKSNPKIETSVQITVVTLCPTCQRLLGLTYTSIWAWQKGFWGRGRAEGSPGVRGSLNFVVEIAAWDMWYMRTQFLFNSSLSQTMTPWLQKPRFATWGQRSLVPPPGSTINEGWQTS